ncbi:ester cyclase [Gammaproteobacteria bacterium]|nr:ester cyclase [Gammaproteobacteria bacterium]
MEDYFFVLQYGQWLILVISILALYLVSSVHQKTRLKGYLVTALSRFSGAIIFLFVDLFAFVIANLIQTYIAIRGYFQNKKVTEGSSKNSEDIVREAMQVIWTEGDISRVGEFYAEGFKADYPFPDWGEGLEGVCALASKVREDLPGYREDIEELLIAGKEVIVVLKISGFHPATNKELSFRDVTIITLENNKIVSQRGLSDLFSLYLKLGLIQMPQS